MNFLHHNQGADEAAPAEFIEEETPQGCPNCNNTGLEPNVATEDAKECPVCNGSPFGITEEEGE